MKKILATIAVVGVLATSACGSDSKVWEERGGEADAICVDKDTKVRVDDSKCDSTSGGNNNWIFWYLLASQSAPRYGYPAQYGQPTVPAGYQVYRHRVPRTGGTVAAKPPTRVEVTKPKTNTWPKYNPNKNSGVPDSKPKTGGGYKPPSSGGYKPSGGGYKPTTRYR